MKPSQNASFPTHQFSVESNTLEFLFNNGQGQWQHPNNAQNFLVEDPGIYAVVGGTIKVIKKYPKVCPGTPPCSNNGICINGTCQCKKGYYMMDCSKHCQSNEIVCDNAYCFKGDKCPEKPLPGCQTYHDGVCSGSETNMPSSFAKRRWQTPERGSPLWKPSYQDFSHLVGYTKVQYDASHTSATVEFLVETKDPNAKITYIFDGQSTESSTKKFDQSTTGPISISASLDSGHSIKLDDVDFIWNAPVVNHTTGDYQNGQKGAIVQMFQWKDEEIEKECHMLSKAGYLGVLLSPHQEQLMSMEPERGALNPWYYAYQPTSYSLNGRMGTRDDLRKMIITCRSLGVRIYADIVANHFTGNGNSIDQHRHDNGGTCVYWPGKNATGGSPFFNQGYNYKPNVNSDLPPSQEYPMAAIGPMDFHCERPLNSWNSGFDLNFGWLVSLTDLKTDSDRVRERIAAYMTDLLSIGISGFRGDAMKHMQPDDHVAIFQKLVRNFGGSLPPDFLYWGEVLAGGEADMLLCNPDSGYNYGSYFTTKLINAGISNDDVKKIKLWAAWYPNAPSEDCHQIDRWRESIMNDDHDQQFGGNSRDMHSRGSVLVLDRNIDAHRSFEVRLFSNPYEQESNNDWPIRLVLSSYYFSAEGYVSPPDGLSDCSLCTINCDDCQSVPYIPASVDDRCGYEASGDGRLLGQGYTLVHRDRSIIMAMRQWMGLSTSVSNRDLGLPDRCQ